MFANKASNHTRARRLAAMIVISAILVIAAWVYAAYTRDISRARSRLSAGSQVIQTACGPIEYAEIGRGEPVLFIHGAGGGFDQGIDLGAPLADRGFRVIAMSRFGYLRTPLPAYASPEAQAEAHACLLDALKVQRAVVIGLSAGGPSAMQFALKYPERTSALVLMVAAAYPRSQSQTEGGAAPAQTSAVVQILVDVMLRSDFLFWAAPRIAPAAVDEAFLGTPADLIEQAGAADRAAVTQTLEHLLPFSPRRLGVLNDAANENPLPRYDLEQITAPTLIISAADDGYGTGPGARYTAEHIRGARLIMYPSAGHLLVGHMDEALSAVATFLRHASQ